MSQLIPVFLANHPNSASVLHYVWHGQVRNLAIQRFFNEITTVKFFKQAYLVLDISISELLILVLYSKIKKLHETD